VGDRTDELAVLDDGRAAHALDDPPRFGKKGFVGDFDGEAFIGGGVPLDRGDPNFVLLGSIALQGAINGRLSFGDLAPKSDGQGIAGAGARQACQHAVHAAMGVAQERADLS